jgi:hypothetical protein
MAAWLSGSDTPESFFKIGFTKSSANGSNLLTLQEKEINHGSTQIYTDEE